MKRNSQKILFFLVPICFVLLFVTSGGRIISILENTSIASFLYKLSFPNTIIFKLCIGYLSGIFIYFLAAYIPNKERERQQNIITVRLIDQVLGRIDSLFRTILKCSTEAYESMENIDPETFKLICKNCKLSSITDYKKILNENPMSLGDINVRENLINNWNFIKQYLNEIDSASMYIDPKIYDLSLKIKKCSLSFTIYHILSKNFGNNDLEAWSSQFYELWKLRTELIELTDKLKDQ